MPSTLRTAACLALALTYAEAAPGQWALGWSGGFEPRGVAGFNYPGVFSLIALDDGRGPSLYAGGDFDVAGKVMARNIARWDGSAWHPVGPGLDLGVYALAIFDDGTGPALYAGGEFYGRVKKWNGSSWSLLGGPLGGFGVYALAVYDDGHGPALYAGGWLQYPGAPLPNGIAKWDGQHWSALGAGISAEVDALAVFDDGGGPALYATGRFTGAGGLPAKHLAKWDGASWSPLLPGLEPYYAYGRALAVHDDGSGPALYVGGEFTTAGGVSANKIAKWDGTSWSALGDGLGPPYPTGGPVEALTTFDDGTGAALYVGGEFSTAGGQTTSGLARWDGEGWSGIGGGARGVLALTGYDDGHGPALWAGGLFTGAGGVGAHYIARWDGSAWSASGNGNGVVGSEGVYALTALEDHSGPALFAGGFFWGAGGAPARNIARWDGSDWSPVGSGTNGHVLALAALEGRVGAGLYVGGIFSTAGGSRANNIAEWDGDAWRALGTGVSGGADYPIVGTLTMFDDGRGPALYAGGQFTTAGGITVNNIARWDGLAWSALGSGLSGGGMFGPYAGSLAVFDDGSGPALYVGGDFTAAGGVSASSLAKWDGVRWWPAGGGVGGVSEPMVWALAVFDDGSGPGLYVSGRFQNAGGVPASNIARWDGTAWSAAGSGFEPGPGDGPNALAVYDDGHGPALYAGGIFTHAGGHPANNIAKWDGQTWSPLGNGIPPGGGVSALAVYDDGRGPGLYVGGGFLTAGARVSLNIARWGPLPGMKYGDLNCDGAVDWRDVDPFVLALSDRAAYEAEFPDCNWLNADCNTDGLVDFADIDPLVVLLGG